jgi:anti-sigma B factor antagonist
MALEIHQRDKEGIAVLDLKGHLDFGPGELSLEEHLQSLLESGTRNVVLNLDDVLDVDNSCAGELAVFAEKFRQAGGKLALIDPKNVAADLLLETTLDTFSEEQAAINSFFPERAVPHYDILKFVEEEEQRRRSESGHRK